MYRIEFDKRALNAVDFSDTDRYDALENFNDYISKLDFKNKSYNNGMRKIWLTKTDYKYVKPFLSNLDFLSIPFKVIKLK